MFILVRGPARAEAHRTEAHIGSNAGRGASATAPTGSVPAASAGAPAAARTAARTEPPGIGTACIPTSAEVPTGSMRGPADIVLQGIENRVLYRMILLCHFKELEP